VSEVDELVQAANLPVLLKPTSRREGLDDPALIGFPHTLPLELALGEQSKHDLLVEYGYTPESWEVLRANPTFQKAVKDAVEMLQREGMAFRVKAKMQSEALLETSWKLIHAKETPAVVKADLIKSTWKVAGLEPKETLAAITPLQIQINL
jgi:hypothetical protein